MCILQCRALAKGAGGVCVHRCGVPENTAASFSALAGLLKKLPVAYPHMSVLVNNCNPHEITI